MNCFDYELAKSCDNCYKKITQIKDYSTEIIKLKRLLPNKYGYVLPHYIEEDTQENFEE